MKISICMSQKLGVGVIDDGGWRTMTVYQCGVTKFTVCVARSVLSKNVIQLIANTIAIQVYSNEA